MSLSSVVSLPSPSSSSPITPQGDNSENELVVGLLRGAPNAWRELNARHGRLLHGCIAKVVLRFPSLVSLDDVPEIYGLFCLNLLANQMHRLRTFDPTRGMRLSSWLGLLAVHTAYDYLRSQRRQPHGICLEEIPEPAVDHTDVEEHCERLRQSQQLGALMRELSERDQEFMQLYFGQGLSPELVASRMGISVKTVYTKRYKIQARLEQLLRQEAWAA